MGRKNEGTVRILNGPKGKKQWHGMFTYADGTRSPFIPLLASIPLDDRTAAKAYAAKLAPQIKAKSADGTPHAETCNKWHGRYLAYCKERGLSTTGDKGYRWKKWIAPTIGHKPPANVTREDVEAIRDELDTAIRDERVKWKTAANAWGELSASLAEMVSSKRKDLTVLAVDPSVGVQAPETGGSTSKVYPYPSELLTLLSAPETDVPQAWKEIHTLAAYTYLRPGELWVLEWSDVDLADERISVTKAWDFKGKKSKSTKTEETRTVPIEPALLPLLVAMHERTEGAGLVVPELAKTNPDQLADITREHFEASGCGRPRLYKRSASERHVVFRSWRDAGITWSIVRGDDVVKVQRRAGHKLIGTTMKYVVEAENRGATFGIPFPPLPDAFVTGARIEPNRTVRKKRLKSSLLSCERRDLNPAPESAQTTDIASVSAAPPIDESNRTPSFATVPLELATERGSVLATAIDRLTRVLATADDDTIADLVAERRAMRDELETLRRDRAGVIDLASRRPARHGGN